MFSDSLYLSFSLRCFPFVTFEDARNDDPTTTTTPTIIYPLSTRPGARAALAGSTGVELELVGINGQRC